MGEPDRLRVAGRSELSEDCRDAASRKRTDSSPRGRRKGHKGRPGTAECGPRLFFYWTTDIADPDPRWRGRRKSVAVGVRLLKRGLKMGSLIDVPSTEIPQKCRRPPASGDQDLGQGGPRLEHVLGPTSSEGMPAGTTGDSDRRAPTLKLPSRLSDRSRPPKKRSVRAPTQTKVGVDGCAEGADPAESLSGSTGAAAGDLGSVLLVLA